MDSDTSSNDFEYSRRIYHDILAKGSEAMDEMMGVARATEHPRAFEVLSGMMKTLADVNGNLLDLHKKKKELQGPAPALSALGGTTNNLFVGTAADLQRLILDQQKIIDITPDEWHI